VEVHENGRIGAVRGADNPYTAGVVCAKVGRYSERIHHPDRLMVPLLRNGPKGSGQFRPIGWNEALDRIAEAFETTEAKHGSEAIWPYNSAGTMGLVNRDGIARLRHVKRYSGRISTICTAIANAGWTAGVGKVTGPDPREMASADLIVMWGGNPVATQVNAMSHVTRARKERGAKLVVIDPYRTGTAAIADLHLALRPGTDAALACAVMHIAFRDRAADQAYMAKYADDPAALQKHLVSRNPAWAASITGLSVDEIEEFAKLYNSTQRAYIRVGFGFTRARNGASAMHAVTCLPTVTGKWQYEGGGAMWNNRSIYHWDKTLIEGLDARDPSIRDLDMSRIASILNGDRQALCDGPAVHAMLIQSTNPASVAPDTHRVRQGLMRDDLFVAVHEQFMTDTARLADLVIPATMFLEHDDLYQAGGHSHIQIGAKVIEPPGECRSNHDVVCGLAARLGAEHRGFKMSAMEIIDETLQTSGWPNAEAVIEQRWVDAQPDFDSSHFITGFGHADGRFRFRPDWRALGSGGGALPALPDHWEATDPCTPERPFRLIAPPARQFLNSTFNQVTTSIRRENRPAALIHPNDAQRLGISDGMVVCLANQRGEVRLYAKLSFGLQPGTIVVEGVWADQAFVGGIGINALTSDEPALPAGGAVFHDTAVHLQRVEVEQQIAAE